MAAQPASLAEYHARRRGAQALVSDAINAAFDALEPQPGPFYSPGYIPTERQRELHTALEKDVLYGGAAGGGKSRALREHARDFCLRYPGVTVLLLRRTAGELRDSHVRKIEQEWPRGSYTHNRNDGWVKFPNGSVIILGHCQHEWDYTRYLSTEYDLIIFDELTTFLEIQYDEITKRLRKPIGKPYRTQTISGTNPGSVGHGWVKRRWIDRTPEARINIERYRYIKALLDDNPHIDPEYAESLEELPEARRNALRWGRWDSFEGQFFREWDPERHVIAPTAVTLAPSWPRARAVDYGASAPFGALGAAVDFAHQPPRVYVYWEHYEADQTLRYHAGQVADLSGKQAYRWSVADPAMAARTQEQEDQRASLLDQFKRFGLKGFEPAFNDRLAGWSVVREYLKIRADGLPGLIILETCPNLIRTLPAMVHDRRNVEDLDTHTEDHLADCLRYLLCAIDGKGSQAKTKPRAGGSREASLARSPYRSIV